MICHHNLSVFDLSNYNKIIFNGYQSNAKKKKIKYRNNVIRDSSVINLQTEIATTMSISKLSGKASSKSFSIKYLQR